MTPIVQAFAYWIPSWLFEEAWEVWLRTYWRKYVTEEEHLALHGLAFALCLLHSIPDVSTLLLLQQPHLLFATVLP